MSKKICSIAIILCTIIYSLAAIQIENDFLGHGAAKAYDILYSIKSIDLSRYLSSNKKTRIVYDNVKQNSEIAVSSSKQNTYNNNFLSEYDKERVLSTAKKLPSFDQEKINNYLEANNEAEVINAISLLKNRLSDKEYNNIKDIELKYSKTIGRNEPK